MKLRKLDNVILFYCPACSQMHPYNTSRWTFNEDYDNPTFEPSLLVHPHKGQPRCHLLLRNGMIEYCGDCDHGMAGQTVPLPDIPISEPWHPDYKEQGEGEKA